MEETSKRNNSIATWECMAALLGWYREADWTLKENFSITLTRFWTLLAMENHQGMSVKQLASLLDLKYTTIAECVSALEHKQAIEKKKGDDDRRTVRVSITNSGKNLLHTWDLCLIELMHEVWGDLDSEYRRKAFYFFYRIGERHSKTRKLSNKIRGDTAFIIACGQITNDYQKICESQLVTPTQAIMLMALNDQGGARPKDIAHLMIEHPYDISKLLSKVKTKELITLEEGSSGREVFVRLNEQGYDRAQILESAAFELLEAYLETDPDERTFLADIVKYLTKKRRNRADSRR